MATTTDLFLFHAGNTDLIWYNTITGDIVYWELNGTALISSGYIATLPDKNWQIVGSADILHQSHTDIIWQHAKTGDVVYWDLTDAALTGSGYLFTMPDPQTKIHAIR